MTSCIINTVCQFFSGTQAQRAGPPPISSQRLVDGFMRLYFKIASDHVPHITDQFIAYTGNTDIAILLNKDSFEPDPAVFAFNEASTSKGTWSMVLLIARGLLRRPSLSGTPTVTFVSHLIQRDITSPLFFLPLKLRETWCGLCSSAPCCCPVARLAVDHSHINGNNSITGHRFPLQRSTTTTSSTTTTPKPPFHYK